MLTYSAEISAATVTSQTVAVHSMMRGLITETHSVDGAVVTVDPASNFFPGELVYAIATDSTTDITGTNAIATQWQFNTQVITGYTRFNDTWQRLAQNDSFDVALGDVDGDGDLDAFVANGSQGSHDGKNRLWLNDGRARFTASEQMNTLNSANSRDVALGDLEGDGDLDSFVVNSSGADTVWKNNGSGTFTTNSQSLGSYAGFSVALGDLDGDGDLDAFVANNTEGGDGQPNTVWRNGPPVPDVSISKSVSPASVNPGDTVTYTLRFSNTGTLTATGVVITDSVPLTVTNPTVAGSSGANISLAGTAPDFVWDVEDLSPDEGGVITLTGTLPKPLAAGIITNTATDDYATANNSDDVGLTVLNAAPVVVDDTTTTAEETAVTISPLDNDSDSNGDTLSVLSVVPPANGTAVISGNSIVYIPTLNYNGTDSFGYVVTDTVLTATGLITVTIDPVNDAPQVITDVISLLSKWDGGDQAFSEPTDVAIDSNGYIYVVDSANDLIRKFTGSGAFVTQWGVTGSGGNQMFSTPAGVAADSSGNIYVTDMINNNIQKFSPTTPISQASVIMSEDGSPTAFDLTLTADDPDHGDTLTWSMQTQPISGTATAGGTGITQTIGYSPPANWYGTTVFTVAVSDGTLSDTVGVTVIVKSVNDAPVAVGDSAMVRRDDNGGLSILTSQPVTIPVLLNHNDPADGVNDSSGLTIGGVGSGSQGGTVAINSNNLWVDYTPTASFTGTETFTYTARDSGGLADTATVTVTVVNGDGGGSATPGDDGGETIVIPGTGISGTITVTVQIPAGAATDTLALVYNEIVTPTETVPDDFVLAGLVFTLDAYINQALQPGYVFSTPITLTIEYSDDDVADIPQGEGSLALYYWDDNEGEWSSDGITVVERDTANNRLVVTINHLTEFALFGKDIALYYFPIIVKNYVVAPDLVITDLSGDSSGITVKLENQGNSTVVKDFWVDVYFNPTEIPTLNQPWASIASQGATWSVTTNIAPGDSLTLTSGGAYYRADLSSSSFPDGAKVYGYVDSVNFGSTYGNVWERNEGNNLWPDSGSAGVQAAGSGASTSGLPGR